MASPVANSTSAIIVQTVKNTRAGPDRRLAASLGMKALAVAGCALIAGLWLMRDATSFSFYAADPKNGRAMDCYTDIERLIGLKESSAWIRQVELGSGGALLVGTIFATALHWSRKRKAKNAYPAAGAKS
jgi:hypothetical protein